MSETRTTKLKIKDGQRFWLGKCSAQIVERNRNETVIICETPPHLACYKESRPEKGASDSLQSRDASV